MERLDTFSIVLVMIIASGAIFISPKVATAIYFDGAPAPLQEPTTLPGLFKILDGCATYLNNPSYGKEIFGAIFLNKAITDKVCYKLIWMGKYCHDQFVNYIAHGPSFKSHLSEHLAKSEEIYIGCFSVVANSTTSTSKNFR